MLHAFQRKILRIQHSVQEQGNCQPSRDSKIYSLYEYLNIIDDIKIKQLEWAGLIMRMKEEWIPKTVLNGKFHNTSSIGKPRTSWAEYEIGENKLTIEKNEGLF
jgi:hypothetical protein